MPKTEKKTFKILKSIAKNDEKLALQKAVAKTGLGIDIGALQYYYPGSERGRNNGWAKANTTEVYGAINYYWLQAKYSHVVSKDAGPSAKLSFFRFPVVGRFR